MLVSTSKSLTPMSVQNIAYYDAAKLLQISDIDKKFGKKIEFIIFFRRIVWIYPGLRERKFGGIA